MPLMPKWVDRQADTVEPMQGVTWYGPTRRMPLLRRMSAASIWLAGEPPPEPMIRPVRRSDTFPAPTPPSPSSPPAAQPKGRAARAIPHEAQLLAVDLRFQVDLRHARHLAAHAQLAELG